MSSHDSQDMSIILSGETHGMFAMVTKKQIRIMILIIATAALTAVFAVHRYRIYQKEQAEAAYAAAMEALEERIEANQLIISENQNTYLTVEVPSAQQRHDPNYLENLVHTTDLPISAYGDSVMLGPIYLLRNTFPNGTVDARQNRSHYELYTLIEEALAYGTLGNPVVLGIGTNGPLPIDLCRSVVELCGDRDIFWLTTTNNEQFYNTVTIWSLGGEYDNVTILDWDTYSDDHPEYFYEDGIHLTYEGQAGYTEFIRNGITDYLVSKLPKEEDHRVLYIGDRCLLTCASEMKELLEGSVITARESLDDEEFLNEIQALYYMDIMPKKAVIVSGNAEETDAVSRIIEALKGCEITLVEIEREEAERPDYPDIEIIPYPDFIADHPEHWDVDGIHFSEAGSKAFADFLKQTEEPGLSD